MDKAVDSVEALRFILDATEGDPNIRAFEVPRNVAEELLAELDRLREFVSAVAVIRSEWRGTNEALDLELGEAIARATG